MILQREGDRRDIDSWPGEHRKAVCLVGFGIGQRQRVTAPAVERVAQMQDPGPQLTGATRRLVLPALPVEGHLERVLDRQRAALDEEQMRKAWIAQHPGEGFDE